MSLEAGTQQEAVRRHVTALFSDVVDFTPLAERLGEEATYHLIRRLAAEQEAIIARHGGKIQDFAGDGILALFGVPEAQEDAALRACATATEILVRLAALAPEFESQFGSPLSLRVGIHTGPAIVGQISDRQASFGALGDTINTAARLQAVAEPRTVAIGMTTHELVNGFFDCVFVGDKALKGKAEPQPVYRCVAARHDIGRFEAVRGRGLSRFVGRGRELDRLVALWAKCSQGAMHVAALVGEAGIGKSRLVHELMQNIGGTGLRLLQGDCLPSGTGTPYLPFVTMLHRLFGINENQPVADASTHLEQSLASFGIEGEGTLPYLKNILGLAEPGELAVQFGPLSSAELVRRRTADALLRVVAACVAAVPTLLVVEDLHWIDSASEEVLARCVAGELGGHLMILTTARNAYQPPWQTNPRLITMHLMPLDQDGTRALIAERLGAAAANEALVRLTSERAEGNPLFAEEIVNFWQARGSVGENERDLSLPSSLENLLMDRVDRLEEGPRRVLRTASVAGRRFSAELVQQAGQIREHFTEFLSALERRELVFPDDREAWADYLFKHALVQEAIYNSILQNDRAVIHRRVAEAIEQRFADRLEDVAEILAHHFVFGGDQAKAIRYLQLAGDKAFRVFSLKEADTFYRQAVALIDQRDDAGETTMLGAIIANWMQIYCWELKFGEMRQVCADHRARIEKLGPSTALSRLLQWLGEANMMQARFDESYAALTQAADMAARLGDAEAETYAKVDLLWQAVLNPDRFAIDYIPTTLPPILQYAEEVRDQYHRWFTLVIFATDELQRGHYGRGAALCDRIVELGRDTGYPPAVSVGSALKAWAHTLASDFDRAIEYADAACASSVGETERASSLMMKGVVLSLAGRAPESLAILGPLSQQARESSNVFLLVYTENSYALAEIGAGDMAGGVARLQAAVKMFEGWGNTPLAAQAHWILGQVYLALAAGGERPTLAFLWHNLGFLLLAIPTARTRARRHLTTALTMARRSGCPGLVAQALLSLARLDKLAKRPADAAGKLEQALGAVAELAWPSLEAEIQRELGSAKAV